MTKARDLANAGTALTSVSATELGYLDGVTSAVQTQLNAKQAVVSGVDSTEIGYLDGVTSAIQTQLNAKAVYPSQTGNSGKYLTTDGTNASWGTVSSGALTKISSVSFSNVASQAFQSVFSGTYRSYIVEFSGLFKSGVGSATLQADFYSGTNTTYTDGIRGGIVILNNSGTTSTGFGISSGYVASFADIPEDGYRRSGGFWNVSSAGSSGGMNITVNHMGGGDLLRSYFGGFKSTNNTAITGFRLFASSGNIDGTVTIYGLEN